MKQLKLTDGHVKRNILAQRQAIVSTGAPKSAPLTPRSKQAAEIVGDEENLRPSKAQVLEMQARSIVSLSKIFEKSAIARETYLKRKTELLERKANERAFVNFRRRCLSG